MGRVVGDPDGPGVGWGVGPVVGTCVGAVLGDVLGMLVGGCVGLLVGAPVGGVVGSWVGGVVGGTAQIVEQLQRVTLIIGLSAHMLPLAPRRSPHGTQTSRSHVNIYVCKACILLFCIYCRA